MDNSKFGIILNQRKAGLGWGGFKHTYQQVLPYITFINFGLITLTAYNTSVKYWFNGFIELWHMVVFVIASSFILMIAEYKFSTSSVYRYSWDSGYTHGTKLRKEIDTINAKLDALLGEERVKEIERAIEEKY